MKKRIFMLFVFSLFVIAGQGQSNNAEQLANRIAQKMKDTLNLTGQQKDQLYSINMQITEWKNTVRQQYSVVDSVRYHLQVMENRRDSLYRTVLDDEKYQLYKQKKRNLVSNN